MSKKDHILSRLVSFYRRKGEVILLESQMEGHPASRVSFFAAEPQHVLKIRNNQVITDSAGTSAEEYGQPWSVFHDFCLQHRDWIFGYLGYDLKNDLEHLSSENRELLTAPDLYFFVPGLVVEIDQEGNTQVLKGELPDLEGEELASSGIEITPSAQMDKEDYLEKVRIAQEHISEGDFYEINLSHPLVFGFKGDGWELYQKMKQIGPVPFAGYLTCDHIEVCSASPERFLARKGNMVWSQPIKGTIKRDTGNEQEMIHRLLSSEKEKAENLMIVDLVRNDLSRIAKEGSVQVKNLFEIQTFQTVHQMVSTVECEVDPAMDSVEILKACFPMGSMTGAPKIAAMKAIEELEDYRRGIYSGAIGYMMPNGDFDFNVVIRSAIIQGGKLVYPVGGAITSDSNPEQEWEETLIKSRALTRATNLSADQ